MNRIVIAVAAGLAGFAAYVAAVLMVGDLVLSMHWAVQAAYFIVAGTAWVMPVRWLMLWSVHQRG